MSKKFMDNITSMQELKEVAIRLTTQTEICFPLSGGEKEKLDLSWITLAYRYRYAVNNGIVSFIDEEKNWYIIPNFNGLTNFLKNSRYVESSFYVPCSNLFAFPFKEEIQWNALLSAKKAEH